MSSSEGKDWIRERVATVAENAPVSVLDIGPGVGTYAKLLSSVPVSRMSAIEIYEPYVRTYRLHEYYDDVIVGDARTEPFPRSDVIILGDVAEHMSEVEALQLWAKAAAAASVAVYLSIPIVPYPQDEIEGNHHEVHVVDDWNHERVLAAFEGITDWWIGSEVGVYERRASSSPRPDQAVASRLSSSVASESIS